MKHIQDSFGLIRNLKVARLRLRLVVTEPIRAHSYKGSKLRGVFGWQLQKQLCRVNEDECPTLCEHSSDCLYNYLFSPAIPSNTLFLKSACPNHGAKFSAPVIIEPPLTDKEYFAPGDVIDLGLALIGQSLEYLNVLINTFLEMGRTGLDSAYERNRHQGGGGKFELTEVWDDCANRLIYPGQLPLSCRETYGWDRAQRQAEGFGDQLLLEFLTPTRFEVDKKPAPLTDFGQLIGNLYWRLLGIAYFHSNLWNIDDVRFADLMTEATLTRQRLFTTGNEDVSWLFDNTYWQDITRRSNSSAHKNSPYMKLGGFMGQAAFTGCLTPYLPLLYLGEYAHVGKQTTFGFGKYKIVENQPG